MSDQNTSSRTERSSTRRHDEDLVAPSCSQQTNSAADMQSSSASPSQRRQQSIPGAFFEQIIPAVKDMILSKKIAAAKPPEARIPPFSREQEEDGESSDCFILLGSSKYRIRTTKLRGRHVSQVLHFRQPPHKVTTLPDPIYPSEKRPD